MLREDFVLCICREAGVPVFVEGSDILREDCVLGVAKAVLGVSEGGVEVTTVELVGSMSGQ